MNSSYFPVAIVIAFGVIVYMITDDSNEMSSSQSSSSTAQVAQPASEAQQTREPFSLTKSLRFDRVRDTSDHQESTAHASTQKSEEGPIEQAWQKAKQELEEGREDLVDAFTDDEKQQKGESSDQAAFEKSDSASKRNTSGQ